MSETGGDAGVPRLQTPRLVLRPHQLRDLEACRAMWADPAVTRYIGGTPSTPQQTWTRMLGYAGHWALLRFGYWAIEEAATGTYVGELGFADFKRDNAPSVAGYPEFGWTLATHAHGRGLATEAALAALGWADAHLAAGRTVCMIDPDNHPSLRVAEKCGYTTFERAAFNGRPVIVFERFRSAP